MRGTIITGNKNSGYSCIRGYASHRSVRVLLGHPGGPFWKNKNLEGWSVIKGEFADGENPLQAAIREFEEETGTTLTGRFEPLQPVTLKSKKTVYAWAFESDFDVASLRSNHFEMEWPPKSGMMRSFPEIDKVEWFSVDEALLKINEGQANLIIQLREIIRNR